MKNNLGITEKIGRCRRCIPCRRHQRLQWTSRMMLEGYQRRSKPLFLTMTYDQKHLPENPAKSLEYTQKFIKRLRYYYPDADFRYFLATEKGKRNGRLHHHMLLWTEQFYGQHIHETWKKLRNIWGAGRFECQQLRRPGGIYYVSKYIGKNITNRDTGSRYTYEKGMYKDKGRLFTWSNRPVLGSSGIERYRELIEKSHTIEPYSEENLPLGWFYMEYYGTHQKIWIPTDNYKKIVKELGIAWQNENQNLPVPLKSMSIEEQLKAQEWKKWLHTMTS